MDLALDVEDDEAGGPTGGGGDDEAGGLAAARADEGEDVTTIEKPVGPQQRMLAAFAPASGSEGSISALKVRPRFAVSTSGCLAIQSL